MKQREISLLVAALIFTTTALGQQVARVVDLRAVGSNSEARSLPELAATPATVLA